MKKIFDNFKFIILFITFLPCVSYAEDCTLLNGSWKDTITKRNENGSTYQDIYFLHYVVNGQILSGVNTNHQDVRTNLEKYSHFTENCSKDKNVLTLSGKDDFGPYFEKLRIAKDFMSAEVFDNAHAETYRVSEVWERVSEKPMIASIGNDKESNNSGNSNSKGNNKNHNSAENKDANSDDSNSSDTNHQSKPHNKRVNLPSENTCISLGDPHKQSPASNARYFLLKNSCAYPLKVSWCSGRGCKNLNSATTISGGESYESWTHISQDKMVHLNWLACQLMNGNNEVYLDHKTKQCWTNVEMQ